MIHSKKRRKTLWHIFKNVWNLTVKSLKTFFSCWESYVGGQEGQSFCFVFLFADWPNNEMKVGWLCPLTIQRRKHLGHFQRCPLSLRCKYGRVRLEPSRGWAYISSLLSAEQDHPDHQATCFRLQISLHAILKHCAPASAFSPLSNLWTSLKEIFVSRRIVRRSLKFDSIYDPPHQTAIPYQKQAEGCTPVEWFCKMFLAALAALYPTYAWSLSH